MTTLGIDTSNYTTSLALSDGKGKCLMDLRKPLKVPSGSLGLRQSDAFYQHISNLREMIESLKPHYDSIDQVVVSTQPRHQPDSYMPVFNAGVFFAQSLALNHKIGLIELSHQEGHLLSGYDSDLFKSDHFIALHISGGTTELLDVQRTGGRFNIECVANTLDLSFGQLIDRIGVYLGLEFPAGKALDTLTKEYRKTGIKISMKAGGFNLSGIENKLKHSYDQGAKKVEIATVLFSYLYEVIQRLRQEFAPGKAMLIIGGVGESQFLRSMLSDSNVYFTGGGLSSDNAVGLSQYPFILEDLCV